MNSVCGRPPAKSRNVGQRRWAWPSETVANEHRLLAGAQARARIATIPRASGSSIERPVGGAIQRPDGSVASADERRRAGAVRTINAPGKRVHATRLIEA